MADHPIKYPDHVLIFMTLFGLLMLMQNVNGYYEFKVGGRGNWSSPSDPNSNPYNQWAESSRFQIGDTLLFSYSGDNESVLEVNEDDYNNCNTDNPIHKYTDGHTVVKFDHSGHYYFISGVKDHCLKNQKLILIVMADRRNQTSSSNNSTAPPPNNIDYNSPPSPAPSGEEAPSPPASVEINPTPAPSTEQSKPKKNAAASSSLVHSFFIAPLGVFVASILLMVF